MTIDQLSIIVAGLLWPFVLQLSRRWQGIDGRLLNAVAILFCYLVAAVDVYATHGGTLDAGSWLVYGSEMATISQLIYRQVIKPATDPPIAPALPPPAA